MPAAGAAASGLRWDDLRILLEISRAGSLSRAAKRLRVDISTVSRRLAALEAALGHPLFDRTRDGLAATAAAGRVLEVARRVEQETQALAEEAPERDGLAGVVTVAAPPGLAEALVIPAVTAMRARYAHIRVELDVGVGVRSLDRREADIAIRIVRPDQRGLLKRRIMRLPHALLASPAYARELGRLEDLGRPRWISWARELGHLPAARWLAQHAPGAEPVLRTNGFQAMLAAVAGGHGMAPLPALYVGLAGLVPVETAPGLAAACAALPEEEAWLLASPRQRAIPRVAAVWRELAAYAARDPAQERARHALW